MKNSFLSTLGAFSLVAAGVTVGASAVQASQLGPGTLQVRTDNGVFFVNNIVDFSPPNPVGAAPNFGVNGTGTVTTIANSAFTNAGVFGVVPGDPTTFDAIPGDTIAKLLGRSFVGADLQFADLFVPFAPTNNVPIDIQALNAGNPFPFLFFDTDGDGLFGGVNDTDDFFYEVTTFTRRVQPGTTGGFDISFDLEGFFIDQIGDAGGGFKPTPSIISIFNGTSNVDPATLGVFAPAVFNTLTFPTVQRVATADGTITTDVNVPEPASLLGLAAVAGLGLAGRLKGKKARS